MRERTDSDGPAEFGADDAVTSRLGEPSPLPVSALTAVDRAAAAGPAREDEPLSTTGRIALGWVDVDGLTASGTTPTASFDLLPPLRRRRRVRGRVVAVPALAVVALAVAYIAAMLLWPLSSVEPTVTASEDTALRGVASALTWPGEGEAGVGVAGFATAASSDEPAQMASTTKLVTALVLLDRSPLEVGDPGPSYDFDFADRQEYWTYVAQNQSALNVPDGGSLTEYQMLQGMLIASASNYADRLATDAFGSIEEYTAAANAWLADNGIDGMTVADASGFDRDNVATPAAMVALAEKAIANPVIAEIVATASAELPGAGEFENTNELLGTDGVDGLKTGSYLGSYNLVATRGVEAQGTELELVVSVAAQPTDDDRVAEAARLLDAAAAELALPSTLPAGSAVATVTTAWGAATPVVTDDDASLILWNGTTAETDPSVDLGDDRDAGSDAGSLTLTGPAGSVDVPVSLQNALPGPDAWWRLTHPLQLLGVAD